jgi:hypothetical protein
VHDDHEDDQERSPEPMPVTVASEGAHHGAEQHMLEEDSGPERREHRERGLELVCAEVGGGAVERVQNVLGDLQPDTGERPDDDPVVCAATTGVRGR